MTDLHMVELQVDLRALMKFLHGKGIQAEGADQDLGYGVHLCLIDSFGQLAPKPWRLFVDGRRPSRILGYCYYDSEMLLQRIQEFADPSAFAVFGNPEESINSRPMPSWDSGRRLGFEVQCCPVGRKARSGIEKDIFLIASDAAEREEIKREQVYCDWFRGLLHRNHAATVNSMELSGFRLVRLMRKAGNRSGHQRLSHMVRPQTLLRGELTVDDVDAFSELLSRGVGRHRAFGYGMLLLKPPS